jgi:hypothetical protein
VESSKRAAITEHEILTAQSRPELNPEPGRYYLFGHDELQDGFAGWEILESNTTRINPPYDPRNMKKR